MTSPGIAPGLKGQRQTIVCEDNVASHVNKFSTPSMIGLMEGASIEAVHDLLEEGQTSVGYEVNVRHIAPADIGATITAHAELVEVERNRMLFNVTAYALDGSGGETKIGEGTHRRAIIRPAASG